jgi:pyruvate,water dikinase
MVDADCAGVMFTKDPTSGADLRVIEAAWGLGESVVSGLVDPDRYRVKRGGTITEIVIGDKHVSVRAVSDGKIEEVATEAARQRSRCLDDRQLELLDELAAACEAVFGNAAHDIEWAFDGSQLYLLQRRAVTR